MSVGENIKRLRKQHNLMQQDLADMLNISNATVSSWEVNRTEPKMGMIERMCEIFNCEKSELIDGKSSSTDKKILDIAIKISNLTSEQRKSVLQYVDFIIQSGENKK